MTLSQLTLCWRVQTFRFASLLRGRRLLNSFTDSVHKLHVLKSRVKLEANDGSGGVGLFHAVPDVAIGQPAALLRYILQKLPQYPTPEVIQQVRICLETYGLCASPQPSLSAPGSRFSPTTLTPNADAILDLVTSLIQYNSSHSVDRHWARASLPELLLLLSRLRIPSHPKLETALILILRRGKLPIADSNLWQNTYERAAGFDDAGGGGRSSLTRPPPPVSLLPTAFRLTQAMAALPVHSHEAWQQLAERHFMVPPGYPLDSLTPDEMTLVAGAFARAGYHPANLFKALSDRLLPAVPHLQPGSLAKALHAFASLRHHDPYLTAVLCREVHSRMRGGFPAAAGNDRSGGGVCAATGAAGGTRSNSGGGSSFLSLAGAALFGAGRRQGGSGPDKAHRAPQFLLEDLSRLAAAAVQLGAGEAAVRGYGSGGGSGGGEHYSACLGEELLAAVAEEAEEAVIRRMRLVMEQHNSNVAPLGADTPLTAAVEEEVMGLTAASTGHLEMRFQGQQYGMNMAGGGSLLSDQLKPVWTLLDALVSGSGGREGAATRAAHVITSRHLVPELPYLEPYMMPQNLVTLLAALLPGPGAAMLRQAAHPYPITSTPQRLSYAALAPSRTSIWAAAGSAVVDDGERDGSPFGSGETSRIGHQLAGVVAALCRRTDPGVFHSARHLIEAWHVLAAARAAEAVGTDNPRVIRQLMAPVFATVVRHVTMLGSAPGAARFVVSCALVSAYDKDALDAISAPLIAALGGGGRKVSSQRRGPTGVRDNNSWSTDSRAIALTPTALVQLAWAVGQLGYCNEELLSVIQAQALALSIPSNFTSPTHHHPSQTHPPSSAHSSRYPNAHPHQRHHHPYQQQHEPFLEDGDQLRSEAAAAAAAEGLSTYSSPLGPLELADVIWCMAVNQFRTNQGGDIRELYLRAAAQGVVHIDDPRWLRLVQIHLLLLLGWAGDIGAEAAERLRSGWFNALSYAWEHQAVARGEHLAGPQGLPPDPDLAASAFRQGVSAAARDLIRSGLPCLDSISNGGGSGGGKWRLHPSFVWGMVQPSADIRLTVPLLVRYRAAVGSGTALRSGVSGGRVGGEGREWLLALDLVRCADEAMGVEVETVQSSLTASATELSNTRGVKAGHGNTNRDETPVVSSRAGAGQLLGPARWRQLILRQLGVIVRPVRQEDWERADARERRMLLLQAMQL